MEFRILGPLEVVDGQGDVVPLGGGKQRALLARLVLDANRAVAVETLVDGLWGESVPETATKAVQIYVSQLRKQLGRDRIVTRPPGYLVDAPPHAVDLFRFEGLLADGRAALSEGHPARAGDVLREALGLWRGPALAEFTEPFAQSESARLEELRLHALEERIEADLALGRHAMLVGELDVLVQGNPLRERLRGQQMLALYRSGRQAEALASYQELRRLLDEELGITPSASLRELEGQILRQDTSLDPVATEPEPSPAIRPHDPGSSQPEVDRPVGREEELSRLRDALASSLNGARELVFVSGEAGIGKTTLVQAFVEEAADEKVLVGLGQCVEQHGAGEGYLPVLDALSRLCRGTEGDRLLAVLRARAPSWLLQLPGLVDPAELELVQQRAFGASPERMLREMTEALEEFSAARPLALVFEDLHWSDPSTLDLIAAIGRRTEPARLLLIGTYRLGGAEGRESPVDALVHDLAARGPALEIHVPPLDVAAVADYLQVRFDDEQVTPELATLLQRRTNGNPLFVERVVDAWVARSGDSIANLVGEIPASVRQLIERRFSALDPAVGEILEAASVAGAEFSAALVAAACDRDPDDVEQICEGLARQEAVIEARGAEEWPDGTIASSYGFTHDLWHEVLYDRLPAGRRARLHRKIGARLADAHGPGAQDTAAEVAVHFVRGGDADRAARYLALAADAAGDLRAYREAIGHLRVGLELLPKIADDERRHLNELDFRIRLGPALIGLEGYSSAEAADSLRRARDLAERLGRNEELAFALFMLGAIHEVRGEYLESEALLERTLALPTPPPRSLIVDSQDVLACTFFHHGAFDRALAEAEGALANWRVEEVGWRTAAYGENPGVSCHTWAALSLWFLGYPDAARERAREAARLPDTHPSLMHARAFAFAQGAIVSQLSLEPRDCLEYAERAIEIGAVGEHRLRHAAGVVLRGWALATLGDQQEGAAEIERGIELSRATGARMDDAYYLGLLGDARARMGLADGALTALDEALAAVHGSRAFFYEAELHRLRGEVLAASGRSAEGEASIREALRIARTQGARSPELRAALALHELAGEVDPLATAYAGFTEGFGCHDLREAAAILGLPPGEPPPGAGAPSPTAPQPPVRYAQSGDLRIAYQVTGSGPVDLVLVPGFLSHLELDWEEPRHARFLERLGSFSRLIRFDKRGTGLSDRPGGVPDLERRMDDVRAVMDAAGSERAVLFGYSEGGPMSILFAATYPERVAALVLYGVYAKRVDPDEDYPWAPTRETRRAHIDHVVTEWGYENQMRAMCPSADPPMARWWGKRARAAASPGAVRALMEMNSRIDVRAILPSIQAPTLVVHRAADTRSLVDEGRYIASRIPGAKLVELPGADHFVSIDPDQILDVVEPFVAGVRADATAAPAATTRVLKTILVSDVVDSTGTASRLGDAAWSRRLEEQRAAIREALATFDGELVDTAGDGVLALFDGPSRAVRCGLAIHDRVEALGLAIRVGVHTGEIERSGDGVSGIAIHVTARVASVASPGEILVTATTHDLVEGSGLAFDDRGEVALKGLERARRLYAAREPAEPEAAPDGDPPDRLDGRSVVLGPHVELLERDEALARLDGAYAEAASGEGRVVFVVGEPGIGKTSLVTRFLRGLGSSARVVVGACDDLSIPRPLGPFRDLSGSVSESFAAAVTAGAPPHEIHSLLVAELARPPSPAVLVLEDMHWADEATADAVSVLGRRIGTLPALVVLTLRGGEAPPGHPLRAAIGAVPAGESDTIELGPLSQQAVTSLAGGDGGAVYEASGGNPFYVTELLAAPSGADLPHSIANAVLARASRLDGPSRRLIELVSVVPNRIVTSLLDVVLPGWEDSAEDPERRGLLEVDPAFVRFRHELARHAIEASIPIAARRALHAEILSPLIARGGDAAEIVHHAEAAGAEDVVAEYALVAAREAAALESNREAFSHYLRAAEFLERLPVHEQAAVLEELAGAAYPVERLDVAFPAIERALTLYGELGDTLARSRCTLTLSRFHSVVGDSAAARAKAFEAVEILEPLGGSVELARAYSALSRLAMLSEDLEQTRHWGEQALELATRLGERRVHAHALINIGTAEAHQDPDQTVTLLEGLALADAAGDRHEVARALNNHAYTLLAWVRPEEALPRAREAVAYAEEHEVLIIASNSELNIAWLQLRAGEWDVAEQTVHRYVEAGTVVLHARTVLAELAVRRGDDDARERLAELSVAAERTGELQQRVPALELEAELAFTSGAPMPVERLESLLGELRQRGVLVGRFGVRVSAWAAVAGLGAQDIPLPGPYAAMARRDWRAAADAFGEVGWTYDRALMLSLLDDEESLDEAIEIARRLGARPLTERLSRRVGERPRT